METNSIGLKQQSTEALVVKLNQLLTNYQIFYMNVRGFHWNIRGEKFFELHTKFEELYTNVLAKIDEIAERILTLGHMPFHSFSDYVENSDIQEVVNVSDGRKAVGFILDGFKVLLLMQRELLKLSSDAEDEGTSALMSDYIREQEKTVWMYSSFMSR